jgi:hypothetical protein
MNVNPEFGWKKLNNSTIYTYLLKNVINTLILRKPIAEISLKRRIVVLFKQDEVNYKNKKTAVFSNCGFRYMRAIHYMNFTPLD